MKGGALSLNLSLNAATSAPAGLQWTLAYAPSDISSLTAVAGLALGTSKTLSCSSGTGSLTCLATGMNASTISSGVVAVVTATLSPTSGSNLDSIPISNVMGALPDGTSVSISGTGGTISVTQPNPTISTLLPANATAGAAAFTLTVNGTGFLNGVVVNWNGTSRTTTFGSATQLTAAITAADIATAGTAPVTVVNPGGGTSGASTFTINAANPVPAITSLTPATATAGTAAFNLTVTGTGFINGSVVKWNGS
ncbi:MAG: cell shape-determining protein, partial [Acidobacteriia bacterium]|nr:cell shape-determining protein [Terriglobia bacterium]